MPWPVTAPPGATMTLPMEPTTTVNVAPALPLVGRTIGAIDLVLAVVLLFVPLTGVPALFGAPTSGCAGLGALFFAWGTGCVVVVCGIWLLVHPRSGAIGVLVLGLASACAAVVLYVDLARNSPPGQAFGHVVLMVPAIAQAGVGALLRRLRHVGVAA